MSDSLLRALQSLTPNLIDEEYKAKFCNLPMVTPTESEIKVCDV